MKQNWINDIHVEGYVFSHTLQLRESKKDGTPFIMGEMNIATDEEATNIVTVKFMYVTEKYSKSKKPNPSFQILTSIMENNNTYEMNGKEASKVRIDCRAEVNDFYTREGELASPKQIGGSFIHMMGTENLSANPATFDLDMLIAKCIEKEIEDGDNYLELSGYAFNFRGDLLPLTITVRNPGGMKYFESQDISQSNPLLTKVWGNIVSTIVKKETVIESAFGEATVKSSSRTIRAWDVIGASTEPMEFNSEATITKEELKSAIGKREEHLLEVKKRQEDYEATKKDSGNAFGTVAVATAVKSTPTANDDFGF